jgi:hypothetical protein
MHFCRLSSSSFLNFCNQIDHTAFYVVFAVFVKQSNKTFMLPWQNSDKVGDFAKI